MNSSMSMDQLKPHLLPIISVVVLVILVPLVMLPWVGDIQKSWDEAEAKQTKLAAIQTKADQLEKMDAEVNKELLEDSVTPAIPDIADPAGLLGTIEQAALASGTVTKGVHYGAAEAVAAPANAAPGTEGASPALKVVTANLSVEGSYANILSFISRTEKIARVLSIESLHVVPAEDESNALVATFDVTSPYEPLPEDLGPSESPLPERTPAKTNILDTVSKLQRANYAPTPATSIKGKNNPF